MLKKIGDLTIYRIELLTHARMDLISCACMKVMSKRDGDSEITDDYVEVEGPFEVRERTLHHGPWRFFYADFDGWKLYLPARLARVLGPGERLDTSQLEWRVLDFDDAVLSARGSFDVPTARVSDAERVSQLLGYFGKEGDND